MAILRGSIRFILTVLLLGLGVLPVIILSMIPVRYRGARLGPWLTYAISHIFNRIFNVRFTCTNQQAMMQHHGIIVANHSSYMDVVAMVNAAPIRFLAAKEIHRQPVIGWFAVAQETVFVDRSNRESRRLARHSITAALQRDPYPPIVVYPEGRLGPGDRLNPFRFGAFELAVENEVAILPCAIHYNRPDVVTWHGGTRHETMVGAAWRLAKHNGPIEVTMIPLPVLQMTRADDAALVAAITQRQIEQVLDFPPAPLALNQVDKARWERV